MARYAESLRHLSHGLSRQVKHWPYCIGKRKQFMNKEKLIDAVASAIAVLTLPNFPKMVRIWSPSSET